MDRSRSSKKLTNPEQSSLTDKDDLLGQALLDILSRGAAILAEINRLADHVPKEVLIDTQDFLFTFEDYFKDPERNETRLNRIAASVQADEEFQAKNFDYLNRFYNVCSGIVRLATDFNRVTRDLRRGYYLSHTLEQALLDVDGKQWIPECMHLVGASLLLLNEKFPAKARERLIVAQYRIKGEASLRDFEQVVALVRDFEIAPSSNSKSLSVPPSPSEMMLARLHIDGRLARAVVSRIQSDDVYGHTRAWPLTEHRSTALANQASLLYVALLFTEAGLKSKKNASDILPLSNGRAEMREIIDKHFSDQWVVVVCTGFFVDLETEWAFFPAAKSALADVVSRVPTLRSFNRSQAKRVQSLLDEYLTRGVLTERYVTDHWDSLLEVLREANAALRWRILHGKTRAWATAMTLSASSKTDNSNKESLSQAETIRLLLTTAQLEHVLREAIRRVLDSKDETWVVCRERVAERMKELAQYFSGQVPLAKVQKDEQLMSWFQGLGDEVARLEYLKTPTATGRRVQALIKALEEVERFDGVDASLQVREFLSDSRALLEKMVRTVSVREEILVQIDVVSDLSYAWGVLDNYDQVWHDRVRQDPSSVGLLRAVFLKLSSILDAALTRLAQAGSPDVDSVAEYWSKKLVLYVKRVLEVVPQSVCSVLDSVGEALDRIPDASGRGTGTNRLALNELGAFAAGESRYDLAKYTHKIAIFTEGVLTMGKCVLGIVEVDPKKVLDDGLRKELRRRMFALINGKPNNTATGAPAADPTGTVWRVQLAAKAKEMLQLKRSFEYVQDYLTLDGIRTWNEELAKVVMDSPISSARSPSESQSAAFTNESYVLTLARQLNSVDWSNERYYDSLLDDILHLLGVMGFVRIDQILAMEQKSLTMDFVKNSNNCDVALVQLNTPQGIVWGSANWVDSIREARRKYPSDQMEQDFKRLTKIGASFVARQKMRYRLRGDSMREAPLLVHCVTNATMSMATTAATRKRNSNTTVNTTSGSDEASLSASPLRDVATMLAIPLGQSSFSYNVHTDVLDEICARRCFILSSELSKRIVTGGLAGGVFSNVDYFYCCAGIATFMHASVFVQELDRCVYCSSRSLCLRSLLERQSAESSIVFKFGAQKVAKVALERLLQEQQIHRVIADLAERSVLKSAQKRSPVFIERIAEMWNQNPA